MPSHSANDYVQKLMNDSDPSHSKDSRHRDFNVVVNALGAVTRGTDNFVSYE